MKSVTFKERPLIETAFKVLLKELGPEKTIRLWEIFGFLGEDYLKLRKRIFKRKSLSKIYEEAKKFNR
jgi:hypothetical protein